MQVDLNIAKAYAQERTLTIIKKSNMIVQNRKQSTKNKRKADSDESDDKMLDKLGLKYKSEVLEGYSIGQLQDKLLNQHKSASIFDGKSDQVFEREESDSYDSQESS